MVIMTKATDDDNNAENNDDTGGKTRVLQTFVTAN